MACVTYDSTCRDCGHTDFTRLPPSNCENCNSTQLNIVKEFDEQFDHYPEREPEPIANDEENEDD
jgi:hypothetical protein